MKYIDVRTQQELDEVLKKGDSIPCCRGNMVFTVRDSSQVTAYDSSQVTACGSSQVTACDSSQVRAYDSSQVRATKFVAVTIHGKGVKGKGGKIVRIPVISTATEWCEFYGVKIKAGVAILFKAVRKDFKSLHGMEYAPGTCPGAPDWDGGEAECGGGLHFSPRPRMALKFDDDATRFVGCPVTVSAIIVHKDAEYPNKVKAPCVCEPCFEVDINGDPIKTKG